MALSLYRKYRPNVFADVVGQQHVERTLVNAVTEGNVAHAYLFCGPRGTGKTTTARLLAKALLCESGPNAEPDGTCQQCYDIAQGSHPDVYELDAASRTGVENVREEIIGRVNFAPTRGRNKIYIIDEVHMLSTAAFNALLKTLEEPPEHVVFVLCTTDPQKVPETIQSRCQRFDFKRLGIEEIVGYLKRICTSEGFSFEEEALEYIAAKANGGMRDATTALEQMAVFSNGAITLKATIGIFGQMDTSGLFAFSSLIGARDTAGCFGRISELVENGTDLAQFARDLASHMRDLYATALTGGGDGIVACPASELPKYRQQAQAFGVERLSRALTVCNDLIAELRWSTDARLSVEVACTRLCRPESDLTLEALSERIAELERNGVAAAPSTIAGFVVEPDPKFAPQPASQPQQEQRPEQIPQPEPQQRPEPAMHPQPEPQPASQPQQRPEPVPQPEPQQRPEQQPQPQPQLERRPEPAMHPQPQPQPQQQPQQQPGMSPARIFQALLTEIKRKDVPTGALLNGVTLVQDGNGYFLEFPPSAQFAMNIACKGQAHDIITNAFKRVTGLDSAPTMRLATSAGGQTFATSGPDFGSGGYSAPEPDDGYFDALSADAPFYEGPSGSYAGAAQNVPVVDTPVEPNFDDPFSAGAKTIDAETAASLADTLSAFGTGIKLTEVDDE